MTCGIGVAVIGLLFVIWVGFVLAERRMDMPPPPPKKKD